MKQYKRDSLGRTLMKLLCGLLGLVLAVLLAGTLIFRHFLEQVNYTPADAPDGAGIQAVLSAMELGSTQQDQIGGPGSGLINILLIGQDAREGEDQARSDSMILCSYNKKTNRLTMTSFLRDLYVEIPGYSSNRINAAYSFGGTPLLKQTISRNFGIHIDGSVEVDFGQFSGIIDLMGGVSIELRRDEAEEINRQCGSTLEEGLQQLDGAQALAYSRIRSLDADGDFSRTNRQRKVVTALLDTLRDVGVSQFPSVLSELLPMITTDLNPGQLLLCALEVAPDLPELELESLRIPADGTFTDKTIDGMSVLSADLEAQRIYLKKTLTE